VKLDLEIDSLVVKNLGYFLCLLCLLAVLMAVRYLLLLHFIQGPRFGNWQCCGSGMFVPDPNFFQSGSRVKKIPVPGSGSASKNLSIVYSKIVSRLSEV
jgi:hypothetical protein